MYFVDVLSVSFPPDTEIALAAGVKRGERRETAKRGWGGEGGE
jgi:hypothetical protein